MKELKAYEHKVQYYETDQMGIVHHSNYIRWFEEARTDFMEQAGLPYEGLEETGIASAIVDVNAKYHSMVRFGDTVAIITKLFQYTGAAMRFRYEVRDKMSGELRCTGETRQCFVKDNKLVSLKRSSPEYDNFLNDLIFI